MRKKFFTLDVFTSRRFSGNQLAVLPDASGLETSHMQAIAHEFNYSETTFVLPPEESGDHRVRIFTPNRELPFAGHPTIGTAILLASQAEADNCTELVLEERAGIVPVTIRRGASGIEAEFRAPGPAEKGEPVDSALVAKAVGLQAADMVEHAGLPCLGKCGIGFLFAEVRSLEALGRARPPQDPPSNLIDAGLANGVYLFTRATGDADSDVRARMFAPLHGIPEDPATGSAAAAFAGLMALLDPASKGEHVWRIAQGVEMGRASQLTVRSVRRGGTVEAIFVSGSAVQVMEGVIEIG